MEQSVEVRVFLIAPKIIFFKQQELTFLYKLHLKVDSLPIIHNKYATKKNPYALKHKDFSRILPTFYFVVII